MTQCHTNYRTAMLSLLLIVQMFFLLSCATAPRYEGSKAQFEDIVITTKVHEAILDEPTLRSFDINVRTVKGIVELNGLVHSREDMDKAIAAARKIDGIRLIRNDMRTYGTGDY